MHRPRFLHRLGAGVLSASLLVSLVATAVIVPVVSAAADPNQISFTLEGCNLDHGGTFDEPTLTCSDDAYTTGNLGKAWAELDYVPMRVTLDNGNGAQTYSFIVAGDFKNGAGTAPGWDDILPLVLNTDLSDASCGAATSGAVTVTPSGEGAGGADQTIYRLVTVTQTAGQECVYDYAMRLAVGAHLFSGSSLQANLWNQQLEQAGIGQKRIQLPVNEIAPQSISKDMSATRNASHMWSLTKSATPDTISFGDTCAIDATLTASVEITISWERLAANPDGSVNILTHVYANNPAHRTITVNVSDQVYEGATQTTPVGAAAVSGPVDVPANTSNLLILTHMFSVASSATSFNDVATATYTDTLTGVPVPGTTSATASATVQTGATTNTTATITDSESITGSGLTFSVATPSVGAFTGGYVAGTATTGPVGWSSGSQSGNGSVTFDKTIYVTSATSTTGTLSDTATLNGSDGFQTSANASVAISADRSVSLDIVKTIPNILSGSETASFTFDVKTGGADGTIVATKTIDFSAGETMDSATVDGLTAGVTYTVVERPTTGWATLPSQDVTISPTPGDASTCSESVQFDNGFAPASARVRKVTVPAGNEAGWEFTLNGPNTPVGGETVTTTGTGYVDFLTTLEEGDYTITETAKPGFDQTSASAECSFSVDYPADADRVFSCTYTNTERGNIIVRKVTDPTGSAQSFDFTASYDADGFSLSDGQSNDSGALVPGTYSVAETVPSGWDLVSATCDDGSTVGSIGLAAGETVTCTFTNRQRGDVDLVKTFNGGAIPAGESFTFQLRQGASTASDGTVLATLVVDSTTVFPAELASNLVPGTYQVCEYILPGYDSDIRDMTGAFVPNSNMPPQDVDNAYVCAPITVTAGGTTTVTIDNTPPPGGMAKTIGFWKNHASCKASNGGQDPVLDETLALFPIADGESTHGFFVGDLYVDTCSEAVALLNKSRIDNGKKQASDPAFNFAAQYVAYQLNLAAGAASNTTAINAAAAGQAILDAANFNGKTHGPISKANQNLLNSYANILDQYNNNTLP